MKNYKNDLERFKVNTRIKLSGLWVTMMLLYIYCDLYSLHRPGYISEMIAGMIGPFEVNQGVLAGFGILMAIPALMIPVCLFLKSKISKWANVIVGALYTLVNIGNLIGEVWAYYWIYGILEVIVTIAIITVAAKWTREENCHD